MDKKIASIYRSPGSRESLVLENATDEGDLSRQVFINDLRSSRPGTQMDRGNACARGEKCLPDSFGHEWCEGCEQPRHDAEALVQGG